MIKDNHITEEWRMQGLSLKEEDNHTLELRHDKNLIARISKTGIAIENNLKVSRQALLERVN